MSEQQKSRIDGTLYRQADAPVVRADAQGNTLLTLSFSSETPYTRSSWFDEPWVEILGHKSSEVDLSRLSNGAPVLANHERCGQGENGSPLASIGVVEKAWLENGRGMAEIKLSRRPEIAGLIQDIADGIVRNVSVGYTINERVLVKSVADGPDEYRVTSWTPMEVSLVDIPADATVGVGRSANFQVVQLPDSGNTKGAVMAENQTPAKPEPNLEAIRQEAVIAERTRVAEINDAVRGLRLDPSFADDLVSKGISADEARRLAINKAAERANDVTKPLMGNVETVVDEVDTRRAAVAEALLHRYDPSKNKLTDLGRQFSGLSLVEIGRDLLTGRGVDIRGMSRDQVATRAMMSTGDFPYILANVASKTLRMAYEAAPQTFRPFCRQVTVPDFKTVSRTALGDAPTLEKVNEHGEYKYGAVSEGREQYAVATYGKIIALTRQTIINDDLSAFTRIPEMYGRAAATLESDTVWGVITANAALADGVALFHANHGNLPTGAAISVAQLGVARAAMRVQTGLDGNKINIAPAYLLVPAALETVAQQYTSQAYVAAQNSNINPFAGTLQVIAEPRLDAASTTAWYLAADPSQIDTIEYAYLEGNQGVYLESKEGWEVDGVEFKARLDFGAKAIDYRGFVKGN